MPTPDRTKTKVEGLLDKVRPFIRSHGGDITLLECLDGRVRLSISGTCSHCSLADITYNKMVRELVEKEVPEVREVVIER